MEEKEFIKEHPSLKKSYFHKTWTDFTKDEVKYLVSIQSIHETQLDKTKVRDAIDDLSCAAAPNVCICCERLDDLKKELGL